jgi:hypothetical protein
MSSNLLKLVEKSVSVQVSKQEGDYYLENLCSKTSERERETEGCQIHFPSFLSLSSPPQVLFFELSRFQATTFIPSNRKKPITNILDIFGTLYSSY